VGYYTNTIHSIAIGSFDGMHIAHQALIKKAEAVVIIERNSGYLTPGYKRSLYTEKPCYFYHFDKIRHLSPKAFVERLEQDFPLLEKIIVGYDFAFGKAKVGNVKVLRELFKGEVEVVDEIKIEGISVHSRVIKTFLKEGNIAKVNLLLGRYYSIDAEVIRGQGIGSKKLVPTLNLRVHSYQLPSEGVYATCTKIGKREYDSVSFVGHRLSTDSAFAVETHLIDQTVTYNSGTVTLFFVGFLRTNKTFTSFEKLKMQIENDIADAKAVLKGRV